MFGFGQLIDILKKDPKKIVFTEGNDPRILEAASRLLAGTFLHPILVGNPDEIFKAAEESGFNIRGAKIIDPANYDRFDEMVDLFCELTKEQRCDTGAGKGHSVPGELLRNHACKDGRCRCTSRRSNLLHRRYRTSCITAD